MKIPNLEALVELEYKGKRVKALVEHVEPDDTRPDCYWITLRMGGDFHVNDEIQWVAPNDRREPTSIHAVSPRGDIPLYVLSAKAGGGPEQSS